MHYSHSVLQNRTRTHNPTLKIDEQKYAPESRVGRFYKSSITRRDLG
jgi:hypothetical protein